AAGRQLPPLLDRGDASLSRRVEDRREPRGAAALQVPGYLSPSAMVVYGAAAALTAMLAVKLVQRGGPYFARPETVMDHLWRGEPCRVARSLAGGAAHAVTAARNLVRV